MLAFIFGATACTSRAPVDGGSPCNPSNVCVVEGTLAIESKWQISLDQTEDCYALALPENFYATYKRFDGTTVRVHGEAFSQPQGEAGRSSWGYVIEGMRINANLCTYAILVQEIRGDDDELLWSSGRAESDLNR